MADIGVEIDLKRGEDHTRERLGGLLKNYSLRPHEVFDHTSIHVFLQLVIHT